MDLSVSPFLWEWAFPLKINKTEKKKNGVWNCINYKETYKSSTYKKWSYNSIEGWQQNYWWCNNNHVSFCLLNVLLNFKCAGQINMQFDITWKVEVKKLLLSRLFEWLSNSKDSIFSTLLLCVTTPCCWRRLPSFQESCSHTTSRMTGKDGGGDAARKSEWQKASSQLSLSCRKTLAVSSHNKLFLLY